LGTVPGVPGFQFDMTYSNYRLETTLSLTLFDVIFPPVIGLGAQLGQRLTHIHFDSLSGRGQVEVFVEPKHLRAEGA
jgi:hypothetical protein